MMWVSTWQLHIWQVHIWQVLTIIITLKQFFCWTAIHYSPPRVQSMVCLASYIYPFSFSCQTTGPVRPSCKPWLLPTYHSNSSVSDVLMTKSLWLVYRPDVNSVLTAKSARSGFVSGAADGSNRSLGRCNSLPNSRLLGCIQYSYRWLYCMTNRWKVPVSLVLGHYLG